MAGSAAGHWCSWGRSKCCTSGCPPSLVHQFPAGRSHCRVVLFGATCPNRGSSCGCFLMNPQTNAYTLKASKPLNPLPLLGRIPPTVIVGSRNGKPWKTPSYHISN
ncbi:hypothetical protein Nmel_012945 [Mimus melanotis]